MPAGSEPSGEDGTAGPDVPALPHTFRPRGVRIAATALGVVLLVAVVVVWVSFPGTVRAQFTLLDLGTVVFFGLAFYAIGLALVRSRVTAQDTGLTVVNGFRTRRFEWNEVLAVSLRAGSPWAVLDLSDGTSVSAMGIQGSDGARAHEQVRALRRLVERHTR